MTSRVLGLKREVVEGIKLFVSQNCIKDRLILSDYYTIDQGLRTYSVERGLKQIKGAFGSLGMVNQNNFKPYCCSNLYKF
jgi:hypothetical protein